MWVRKLLRCLRKGHFVFFLAPMCEIFLFRVDWRGFAGAVSKKPEHSLVCDLGLCETPMAGHVLRYADCAESAFSPTPNRNILHIYSIFSTSWLVRRLSISHAPLSSKSPNNRCFFIVETNKRLGKNRTKSVKIRHFAYRIGGLSFLKRTKYFQ